MDINNELQNLKDLFLVLKFADVQKLTYQKKKCGIVPFPFSKLLNKYRLVSILKHNCMTSCWTNFEKLTESCFSMS